MIWLSLETLVNRLYVYDIKIENMHWIIELLISAASFFLAAYLLSEVKIKNFAQAIVLAIVIAFLDITVGTFLKIITLGILSIGIFNWLLNAILILIADWFLKDFEVKNFWWALALAAIVSIINAFFHFIT